MTHHVGEEGKKRGRACRCPKEGKTTCLQTQAIKSSTRHLLPVACMQILQERWRTVRACEEGKKDAACRGPKNGGNESPRDRMRPRVLHEPAACSVHAHAEAWLSPVVRSEQAEQAHVSVLPASRTMERQEQENERREGGDARGQAGAAAQNTARRTVPRALFLPSMHEQLSKRAQSSCEEMRAACCSAHANPAPKACAAYSRKALDASIASARAPSIVVPQ